jgi:hypothetical protein
MKAAYWLVVVVLAVLYVKYYHVIGPRLLLMLAGLYALRFILNRLRCLFSPPGNTNAEETNRAIDAEYEIIDDDKNQPPPAA